MTPSVTGGDRTKALVQRLVALVESPPKSQGEQPVQRRYDQREANGRAGQDRDEGGGGEGGGRTGARAGRLDPWGGGGGGGFPHRTPPRRDPAKRRTQAEG